MTAPHESPFVAHLHAQFLEILQRIEEHGKIYFRHVKSPDRKAELLAELRRLCWKWFVRLVQKGKDVLQFVSALATYAARAVHSGRRVCGHERVNEVLSPVAQRRRGFRVESLPISTQTSHEHLYATPHGQQAQDAFEERLRDNTVTPPPDQAAFRIDFPAWLTTQTERDRRLIDQLMVGERTKDVSRTFGLSPARISQKRREFHLDWTLFTADDTDCVC